MSDQQSYVTAIFRFTDPKDKPEGKLADAGLVFAPGPLGGTKLTGVSLWEGRNGAIRVKGPQRKVEGKNGARDQYYGVLVPVDEGLQGLPKATQDWLIDEYRRQRRAPSGAQRTESSPGGPKAERTQAAAK